MSIGTRVRQLITRGASANDTRAVHNKRRSDVGGPNVEATDISFTNPDTIESAGSGFPTFVAGNLIQVSGSESNNRTFVVLTSSASTITVEVPTGIGSGVVTESAGATIQIRSV